MKIFFSFFALTFITLFSYAQAQEASETLLEPVSESVQDQSGSLNVNDFLPEGISLQDQNNETKSLSDLYGENGMVLVFYRSADWCPYCLAQLINLKAYQNDFASMGYSIVGVSYDSVETLNTFSEKYKISYPLLSDAGSETIKKFGIFNVENTEDSFAYGVPYPTIYVVQRNGSIKVILTEQGYKKRPEISDIKAAIQK